MTSPNYPDEYEPNTICKWNITTDKGHYVSLDFETILVSYINILLFRALVPEVFLRNEGLQ